MSDQRFLSLHALHSLPAGCLNRDRDGAINKIVVGGTPRIRVSSRAWKRALRQHLRAIAIDGGSYGVRTARMPLLVAEKITSGGGVPAETAVAKTAAVFTKLGMKANPENGATKVMVFADGEASDRIAALIADRLDDIVDEKTIPDDLMAQVRGALDIDKTVDVGLMGRFLAEIPDGTLPAALSAAHSFTVHPAAVEADFFSAVDDTSADGDSGAGHIGTTDLAASIMYRHIGLDRPLLRKNLTGCNDATLAATERAVVDAFIKALPTGKRTSTAATTLPAFVMAVHSGRETSLADTFDRAVVGGNVMGDATDRLYAAASRALPWLPDGATVRVLPVMADPSALPTSPAVTVVDSIDGLLA